MTARPLVRIGVLGPVEVMVEGVEVHPGGPGRRALLAALALDLGLVVSTGELFDAIWGECPPLTALTKLHGHVHAVRRELARLGGPEAGRAIQTKPPGYALCSHRTTTDLHQFHQHLARAASVGLREGAHERVEALTAALALWRGPACSDVPTTALWQRTSQLAERRLRAVEDLAEAQLVLAQHNEAIDRLRTLVSEDPYRERAWELLMLAYLGRGDAASAVAAYDQLRQVLRTDLGVTPSRRIQDLRAAIVDGRPVDSALALHRP